VWLLSIAVVLLVGASVALFLVATRGDDHRGFSANPPSDAPRVDGSASPDEPTGSGAVESTRPTGAPVAGPTQLGCSNTPSACGYPDATNTGVPPGTTLTVIDGGLTVRTAGAVIEGKDIRGCVIVKASNVTIRRSKVTCTSGYGIASFPEEYSGGGLVVEDVEVDCANSGATAIGYYGLTGRRLNLHGCENGFDIDYDVTVLDSYIHDMRQTDTGHTDGIQLAGGSNIVIRHNTIFNPGGTSAIISHPNANADVTIEANLLGGGAYTLYCPRDSSTNFRVINNRFSTLFGAKGGEYGPWEDCHKIVENRGNVWDSTLAPVT
jgi:hypothetical protein